MAQPNFFDQFDAGTYDIQPDPERVRRMREEEARRARDEARANAGTDLQQRGEIRQQGNDEFARVTRLAENYNSDKTVAAYRVAIGQLAQALNTGAGAQADLALTYAFAKAMDPDSVVRESEQGMVTDSQPWFQANVERAKKQFGMDGAGNYTPAAREKLRRQIINSVTQRNRTYVQRRRFYTNQAKRFGIDPQYVVGDHDGAPFRPMLEAFDKRAGRATNDPMAVRPQGGQGSAPPRQMIPGTGGPSQLARSQGETYSTPEDVALAQEVDSVYRAGGGVRDLIAVAQKYNRPVDPQQAQEWQSAIDYRDGTGQYQGQPGGYSPVNTPESGRRNFIERALGDAAATRLGTAGIGAANAMTMGGIDEITGGINALRNGSDVGAEIAYADLAKQSVAAENPGSYLAGNLLGAGAQALGLGLAAPGAAAASVATLPRTIATGTLYGAATGGLEGNDDRLAGMGTGAVVGAAGGPAGRYVLGPTANAVMGTRGGQAVSNLARGAYNRLPENPFGRVAPTANVPNVPPEMRPLLGIDDPEVIRNLEDAQRLGLPYTLADANPQLRTLGGAVTRKSVNARGQVESVLEPRARGQAERAYEAIDTRLAPVTDIPARGAQWREAANTASGDLYAAGRQRAAPVDPRVSAFLETPAGRTALKNARTMAANDGRDPNAMGFDLDEQGEVIIREVPSWETLDYVKRGIDQQLEGLRNPLTGALDLEGNPAARALDGFRKRFVGVLDELNPDYKAARKAYEEQIRNRDALDVGRASTATTVRPRDIPRITGRMDETQAGEFRRGFATGLADTVNDTRLSGNPYDRIYGTPNQRDKLAQVFPDASQDFGRIYELERDMAKTVYETLGGSPTAGRLQADAQLGDMLGGAVEIGADALTGGGASGIGMALNTGRRYLGDAMRLGVGRRAERNAENLAPSLFDPNPQAALDQMEAIQALQAAIEARRNQFRIGGGLFGSLVPTSAALANQ